MKSKFDYRDQGKEKNKGQWQRPVVERLEGLGITHVLFGEPGGFPLNPTRRAGPPNAIRYMDTPLTTC